MSWRKTPLLLLVPCLLGVGGSRARETLDRAFANLYGSNRLAAIVMRIERPGQAVEEVAFAFGRKTKGGETRTLLYQSRVDRDASRALLLQSPGRNDRMYVTRGARGQVRPVSTGARDWPLFGSDFSYEDFRVQSADDYRIEVLGPDRIALEDCQVMRLRPTSGPYAMILTWISTERPVIVRMDYFDAKGLLKRYRANMRRVRHEFDAWVTMEDEMLNLRTGSRTLREIGNIVVDLQVPDEIFSLTQLARGRLPAF